MATPHADTPLRDRRVLVCRPQPEAERLAARFRSAGARARTLPLLVREPLAETPVQRGIIQDLDRYQHIIVVSPYAARQLLARIDTWWPQLPVGIHWYGVGAGTVAVLEAAGLSPQRAHDGVTSEHLLALPALADIAGTRVLIARGEGGRDLIPETLRERGAEVTLLPMYRRHCPDNAGPELTALTADFKPEVVITLSGETLNNFIALSENSDHNCSHCLLVVPARRIARQAQVAGYHRLCVPASLGDQAIVDAVSQSLAADPGPEPGPP